MTDTSETSTTSQTTRRGRPRSSTQSRVEQVRAAKRRQRAREGAAGTVEVRLKLPVAQAEKLAFAMRHPRFADALRNLLERDMLRIADFPQLQLLCWNRQTAYIDAADAWSLYDRNHRFVDTGHLAPDERALLSELERRFGPVANHD